LTFNLPDTSILSMASSLGWLYQVFKIFDANVDGETRWKNVQEWLKKNPDKQKLIDDLVRLPPQEAYLFLLGWAKIDPEKIEQMDPLGIIREKAHLTIGKLQALYKDRVEFDQEIQKEIQSIKKKKGKKKHAK
jgi:hypothetical protein